MIISIDIAALEDLILLCKKKLDLKDTEVQETIMFAEKAIDNLKQENGDFNG